MLALRGKDLTFRNLLREQCKVRSEQPCILFESRVYSYGDVDRLSDQLASNLLGAGVEAGSNVAIMMENRPEFIFLYIAIAKIRAVAVPLNVAAKGDMLQYFLAHADVEYAIADATFLESVREVAAETKLKRIYAFDEAGGIDNSGTPGPVEIRDLRELFVASSMSEALPEPDHTDPYILLYTSGTTGRSKASVGTHHSSLMVGSVMVGAYDYTPADTLYVCLPLFHGNAWQCSCIPALYAGATIALSRRFSLSQFWDEVRSFGATQFNLLSSMTNWLWSQPTSSDDADNAVRQCMIVPSPAAFYDEFRSRFGIERIHSVYALTDVGIVTITRRDDPAEKKLSAGRASDIFQVKIFDEDDGEVEAGSVGEIVVRNAEPWAMPLGYYNDAERTLLAWRNLWFHTGDRGYFDPDGFLYFVDRKTDSIRRLGENISSYEVEQIVLTHPGVRDVAAFPIPSHSEDEVMISVLKREGWQVSEADLVKHCAKNMPHYMVPRYIEFVDEWPRTLTEKVEKHKLRERAVRTIESVWDSEKAGIRIRDRGKSRI